jgi:tRNA threonylcarbamoyladenosine biosynthesis protein TsaB
MALILNIDTAVEIGEVNLAENGSTLRFRANSNQKDHAAWIQTAILEIMKETGYSMHDLQAVAVSNGPGSYTGLRVSLATAKGICYALQIPLITIGTLEIMAATATRQLSGELTKSADLLCPMIDARRMEVYMAAYNRKLEEIIKPQAVILDGDFFGQLLEKNKILFFGNGSHKLKNKLLHPGAVFADVSPGANDMVRLSHRDFLKKNFADLAYTEPLYIKEFYSAAHKPSV